MISQFLIPGLITVAIALIAAANAHSRGWSGRGIAGITTAALLAGAALTWGMAPVERTCRSEYAVCMRNDGGQK
jgi:hypothetical protein